MNRKKIKDALTAFTGGRTVMTASEFAKAMGYKDINYAKKRYLDGLETVCGKYFIEDIITRLGEET